MPEQIPLSKDDYRHAEFSDEQELEYLYGYLGNLNAFNDLVFWTEIEGRSDLFRDIFFGKRELPSVEQRITLVYNYLDSIGKMNDFDRWLETSQ